MILSRRGAIGALLSVASGPLWGTPAPEPATLLYNGFVVDPRWDGAPRRMEVLIAGEWIVMTGRGIDAPASARRIDLAGGYISPGLWDMHAHVAAVGPTGDALSDYLAHGVLGIRDMGGRAEEVFALRDAVRAGRTVGPTMVIAGPTVNGEPDDVHLYVRNADEARAAARRLAGRGVDFIKIHRRVSREAFHALVDEARRLDLRVAGHVPLAIDWIEGAEGGMATIEHIQALAENEIRSGGDPVRATNEAIDRLLAGRADAIFAAMARRGVYFTPSMVYYEWTWERDPPERRALKQAVYARLVPLVRRAFDAGVPILLGTDLSQGRGVGVWDELDRLVRAGLTPRQALAAATVNPFRLLGRGPGPIVAGGEASLIVTARDPTADIAAVREMRMVMLRGRVLAR